MKRKCFAALTLGFLVQCASQTAFAWDYPAHRVVNQLALASLPRDFPAFVRTPAAEERIAFLAGEPDRWRNVRNELPLSQANGPDHYLDMESLANYGMTPETMPIFRYDFAAKIAVIRAEHPEKFPAIDPEKDRDHTRELVGFLPYSIVENAGKLKSCFSYLKTFQQNGGTPEEIANAEQNVIYVMGVMGHYVGDGSQPLHTTIYHHGWIGPNPHGYTRDYSFHQWIDGGYFAKVGLDEKDLEGKIHPAHEIGDASDPHVLFHDVMNYIEATHNEVEPLYQLDKEGKLTGDGEKGLEGRAFLDEQLVRGGQMLGDIWYSAWKQAPEDHYLKEQLLKRENASAMAK